MAISPFLLLLFILTLILVFGFSLWWIINSRSGKKRQARSKVKKNKQAKDDNKSNFVDCPSRTKSLPKVCVTSTRSYDVKTKGNTLYELFQTAYGRVEKISFLHRAIAYYDQASGLAKIELSGDDLVQMTRSLAKNKGLAYRNIALLEERKSSKREGFFKAAELFTEAFYWAAQMTSDKKWATDMELHVQKLVKDFIMYKDKLDDPEIMLRESEVFMQILSGGFGKECKVLALCLANEWLAIGHVRMERAMQLLREEDYKKALCNLKELYCPIEEIKKLVSEDEINNLLQCHIKVLEEECQSLTFVAEALQAMKHGKELMDEATKLKASNKIDEAHKRGWDAIDKLKEAKTLAKDQDDEVLCQILLNLGKVFLSVFGLKYQAKSYILEVINLSTTINGNLYSREWYTEAARIINKLKQEEVSAKEAKWENIRQTFLKELTKELKKIWKIKCKELSKVFRVLKEEFVPKHQEVEFNKLGDCPNDQNRKKKFLAKLITLYHPDRVDKTKHGLKYYILCEEITKMLTNKYNDAKEML